ncbi:MAG: glycine zipper 2TM domain-containing protein [Rubrivivax sp.]|nr:glycine zipper 2TM domain-containing protein [Rubrivivax sp.]
MKLATSRVRASKLAIAGLALVLGGCVIAPPHPRYHPRVRVWVPFPIWFVPVAGYRHSESSYDRDRYECYRAAVRETGIDPGGFTPIEERVASSPPAGADVAAGAAVGAVAGGIVSSPRNAGAGMVIGALLGAAAGAAVQDSRERAERAEREAREARARRDGPDDMTREEQQRFRRAMSDCMERRGYRPR